MKTAPTILRLAALIIAIAAPAVAAAEGSKDTSFIAIYIFLSFCALIILGQLIPLITSFLSARKAARLREEEASALAHGESQEGVK